MLSLFEGQSLGAESPRGYHCLAWPGTGSLASATLRARVQPPRPSLKQGITCASGRVLLLLLSGFSFLLGTQFLLNCSLSSFLLGACWYWWLCEEQHTGSFLLQIARWHYSPHISMIFHTAAYMEWYIPLHTYVQMIIISPAWSDDFASHFSCQIYCFKTSQFQICLSSPCTLFPHSLHHFFFCL